MSAPSDERRVRAASRAVFAVFVLNGFNFASWASRLPAVRDGLGLPQEGMGLLLLVGAVGSLLALPLAGVVVDRLGARRTVLAFALANAAGLVVASVGVGMGRVPVVVAGLVLFGIGTAMWDAAMNLEGAFVEQHLGRTVMPRYHAGFSFGTMAAAGVAALAAAGHVPVTVHLPVAVGTSAVLVALAVRWFLPGGAGSHAAPAAVAAPAGDLPVPTDVLGGGGAVPTGAADAGGDGAAGAPVPRGARGSLLAWTEARTLLIGLVVLAAALTEGSANDWASLAVVDGFGTSHAVGAMGFGVFVTAMTAMRLWGTRLLDRYGRVVVLRLCSALAVAGLALFALAGPLWLAMLGVVAWGMGAALGFPVGMSAASDDPVRAAARVSVVSTIGYSAFLAGPPLLGLLAQHVGYRHALLAIVVPSLLGLLVVQAVAPLRSGVADRERSTLDR